MLNPNEFVKKIRNENQALFEASKMNVKAYFEGDLPQEEMVDHFIGRMVNERMNMTEISAQIANVSDDADPKELELLTKQAHDEAKHYRMVREVIEHIKGEEIDVVQALEDERKADTAKGATLLEKYGADDEAVLAAYQLVAEGRAEAVWNQMADTIQDEFISTRYREIAKDEGFHSAIGGWKLRQVATDTETQDRVQSVVEGMRKDLFEISCQNTVEAEGSRKLVSAAYGWQMRIGLTQRVLTHNREVYDSLDHNWYRLLRGHELVPVPNRDDLDYESLAKSLDLLIITGGGNERVRITAEISLATDMIRMNKPILGICHGAFLLTQILGGTTKGGKEEHYDVDHMVLDQNSSPHIVNSYHNICIDKQPPNSVLLCTDTDGDVESWIKDKVCAIVWHPERMLIPYIPEEIMEVTGL